MPTEKILVRLKKMPIDKTKILPCVLFFAVILLDQVTKILVVNFIAQNTVAANFFGDFLRIIHVRNHGVAFSIGQSWSENVRGVFFRFAPLAVLIVVILIYFRSVDFTALQRWAIMGIAGGGVGNLIDRFFRVDGVVDFIDVKFFGIFGLQRWPTFNVADSAVVVCGILLLISFVLPLFAKNKEKKN